MDAQLRAFAISLIDDNKTRRQKQVTRLQAFVATCSPSFEHDDYFKLWEALFFAIWSADGQVVQRRLGVDFCKLLHSVPEERVAVWFDAFWFVLQRDWNNLDRYRVDKFQLLVRMFVAETFQWLRDHRWEEQHLASVTSSWEYGPLRAVSAGDGGATGVAFHLVDVIIEELRYAVSNDQTFNPSILVAILRPFLTILCTGNNPGLAQKIHDKIILVLDPSLDNGIEAVAEHMFVSTASAAANVNVKRVYASIYALDEGLARVGRHVDYSKVLTNVKRDLAPSEDVSMSVAEMKKMSKDARRQRIKRKVSTVKNAKVKSVVFSTRRRKVAGRKRKA